MRESQQQRYRVIDRLAAGGMAEVYRAESAGLEGFKKQVAIKRVLPHLSEKKKFISMFLDEARLGAHLSHANCVQVFDVGVGDNTYFIVMEYVDGADLKGVIEYLRKTNKTFTPGEAVHIAMKICEGLSYAHELTDEHGKGLQIVHRDMSPPNVLITKYGEVKIADFGLAKASSQLEKSEPGIIKGKFSYLSPEAATGQDVDARTDIFAVGIILWEMLAGRKLFQGETDFETVKQVQRAEVPSLSKINRAVDPKLEAIIAKGLTRDPKDRYATARDFGRDLAKWLFGTGTVVTPYDIAEIVQKVVKEKAGEKKTGPANVNIIDRLIEQALFEFTSLQSESDPSVAKPAANKKLDAGTGAFENLQDWGSELGDLGVARAPSVKGDRITPPTTIEGNLSALEDDEPAAPRDDHDDDSEPPPPAEQAQTVPSVPPAKKAASTPPPPPQAIAKAPTAAPVVAEKKGNGAMIGIVVVVVLAIGAAGAYFGGLFG